MLFDLLRIAAGLAVLLAGAWLTVHSAVALATSFGVSRIIIGATVVAFGTSAPEFVVSFYATVQDSSGIAVGNVLGSNVANVALVLGASAAVRPMTVHWRLLRWEIPVLVAGTLAVLLFAANGQLSRVEGAVLFAGLVAFIAISPRLWPELTAEATTEAAAGERGDPRPASPWRPRAIDGGLLVAGLAALTLGADTAVRGAVAVAERAQLSETAIGATIVATGTSLPEVATSVVAAFRREHEIAVANVIGSNIFNLLGVLGLTAAAFSVDVSQDLFMFEMPALALSTVVLLPLAWPRYRIGRPEGIALLALYVLFIAVVLARS